MVHFGSFWFILQNPSFYSFLQLIGLPVFWRWHHLPVPPHHQLPQADNWWENQRWQIHLIQLPLNEQRGTTSLWSFPFVRCIHSDYITWLSKWLCMHIIPSFLVDKASCTRQFESELSLHSLASLFPIKEGIFSYPSVSLSKGSSSSIPVSYTHLLDTPWTSSCVADIAHGRRRQSVSHSWTPVPSVSFTNIYPPY